MFSKGSTEVALLLSFILSVVALVLCEDQVAQDRFDFWKKEKKSPPPEEHHGGGFPGGFGMYPLWKFHKFDGFSLRPVPIGIDVGQGIPPPPPQYMPPSALGGAGWGQSPPPSYAPPSGGYSAPAAPSYAPPSGGYSAQAAPSYGPPSSGYSAPAAPSYGPPAAPAYTPPAEPAYTPPSYGPALSIQYQPVQEISSYVPSYSQSVPPSYVQSAPSSYEQSAPSYGQSAPSNYGEAAPQVPSSYTSYAASEMTYSPSNPAVSSILGTGLGGGASQIASYAPFGGDSPLQLDSNQGGYLKRQYQSGSNDQQKDKTSEGNQNSSS